MNHSGTLLMLGAGFDQLPAYYEARRRGFRLIAVDQRADSPGAALADRFLAVSTRDTERIAALLAREALAGIVTTASDAALGTHRALAIRYGLPYAPADRAVRASMDKTYFRHVVAECGLPTYRWVAGTDRDRLTVDAKELPLPLVVKPTDASGGKGITVVTGYEQLTAAIDAARALSRSGLVLVEEYVDGRHYAVEIWMRDGAAHFVPVTEKRMTPLPAMVTTGHLIPARLTPSTMDVVRRTLARLCTALGITDGPANFDFILTADGEMYVVEVGARLGGNAYPILMAQAWGVDTVGATVSLSVGQPFDLTPTRTRVCLLHLIPSPLPGPGRLRTLSGVAAVRAEPRVCELELFTAPGRTVLPFTEAGHKVGYAVLVADDHDELDTLLAWFSATLHVSVEPTG